MESILITLLDLDMASPGQGPSRPVTSKSLDALLQCSVCYEKFDSGTRSPRQLQCHHTFCLQCLTSTAKIGQCSLRGQNSLKCPTCRQWHRFDQGGVQEIPADHKIVQLMDVLFVSEEESDLCRQHRQQPLNFFCKTCEVPVCRDCTVVLHKETKGHDVLEISEALKEFSPQFINTRDRGKKISEKLLASSSKFNKAMEQLTENEASGEKQILKAFAGYRERLDEREKALLSQLRGYVSRDKEEIENLLKVVDHEASIFKKLDEQFKEAEKQKDIRQHFHLMHQMKEWETSSTDLASDKDEDKWYEYKPHNENAFRKELLQLGIIDKKPGLQQQEFVTEPGSAAGSDNASPLEVQGSSDEEEDLPPFQHSYDYVPYRICFEDQS